MAIDPTLLPSFAATVDWFYAGLIRAENSASGPDREKGLGGSLLYAGELVGPGCALVVAANIAGAASLSVSADFATQRQAIRGGVIDFLVNNLDEALRILKNAIRKRETVAVCVAQAPEEVEREMRERGVLPDLLPPGTLDAPRFKAFLRQGARQVDPVAAGAGQTVLTWSVAAAPAIWLPKLDAIASDCIASFQSPEAWPHLRWLRLSPRYLGRLVEGVRLLRCDTEAARDFLDRVRRQVANGQLGVSVEIGVGGYEEPDLYRFSPPTTAAAS
jgi:urocanate hydratase